MEAIALVRYVVATHTVLAELALCAQLPRALRSFKSCTRLAVYLLFVVVHVVQYVPSWRAQRPYDRMVRTSPQLPRVGLPVHVR